MSSANPGPASEKMTYVRLGKSGLKVSRLILGCMSYGTPEFEPWILDEKTSIEHIRYAYEQGINTFDTANMYSNGESEIVLGKAIKAIGMPRESIVILTKVFFPTSRPGQPRPKDLNVPDQVNNHGLSRKHIFASVKASLERMQLDYVDVLQCHRFDPDTPIEETMQALHDVVQAGYARYIGMSSCWAYQFQQMQNYAITNRLTPFISMQNFHNAAYREEEREMVPTLKMFGVGMIPWSPLSRGFLTRPLGAEPTKREKTDGMYTNRNPALEADDSRRTINARVHEVAQKRNISMAQVAVAWCLAHDYVTAPIVGTTKLESLKELVEAVHITLTPEEKKYIDDAYTPRVIIGHS